MLKWIRPSGAIIFLILITVIGLFWWLLADWLLKASIEAGGTKIVGARVELSSADLTLSPLAFQLTDLQVTNPKQPMQNLIQLGHVTGSLELLPLLMGQVIIDELGATGVRLNTDRKYSGEIKKTNTEPKPQREAAEKSKGESRLDFSSVKEKLPSVDDILAKEPLVTLDKIRAFEEHIKVQRTGFEKSISALPDKTKLEQHEKQIKELTEGKIKSVDELKQRQQDLKQLKDELRADRDALRNVRDHLKNAKGDINTQFSALKNAPSDDWNHLKSRYGLDTKGAGNITGLLFGDSAKLWLSRILSWAEEAQRILPSDSKSTPKAVQPERSKGRFINFATSNPLPDFLIRKAALSMEIPAGNIDLELDDVTHQPNILGRPMRLHAEGHKLQNAERIKINGVIDHVKPDDAKDTIIWSLAGLKMANVVISKNASLPLTLVSAHANFSGDIKIKSQSIAANVKAAFNGTQWNSTATEGWQGRVAQSLTSIQIFNLDGQLQGKLTSPQIKLHSNLDDQLKQAVAGQLKSTQADLEKQFKARLNDKITNVAGPYKDQLAFLTDKQNTLDQRINKLDEMLKAKLKSAIDTKKQEATEILKDKIKGLKF